MALHEKASVPFELHVRPPISTDATFPRHCPMRTIIERILLPFDTYCANSTAGFVNSHVHECTVIVLYRKEIRTGGLRYDVSPELKGDAPQVLAPGVDIEKHLRGEKKIPISRANKHTVVK